MVASEAVFDVSTTADHSLDPLEGGVLLSPWARRGCSIATQPEATEARTARQQVMAVVNILLDNILLERVACFLALDGLHLLTSLYVVSTKLL
jgi:hypothetical protein